jgi:predicted DNA-binding transcriptional regulator AlpA
VKTEIKPLWTAEQTAEYLGIPRATLYQWRYLRIGPKGGRVGRHLRYDPDEVVRWFKEQQEETR